MNSNTTPNNASPTNTTNINAHNPTTTPIRNNVVSQSQGSGGIEALIEATVRTSNGVFTPQVEQQLDTLEAHLYDDNLNSQIPTDAIATIDPGIMPETLSPVKRDLLVNFEESRKKRRRDGLALRQTNYEASCASLQCAFPFETLCTFLCDSKIDAKLEDLRLKPISMSKTMGSALNYWKRKKVKGYPSIMEGIKSVLESAPYPIGPSGRRLFLEDYMMLEPGDEVICYITPSHPDFKSSKGNQKLYLETCTAEPLRPMIISDNVYFAMRLTVRSNALYNSFQNGVLTKEELKTRCTRVDGSGITFDFETDTRIVPKCFKFCNFLEHPTELMFWQNGLQVAKRITQLKLSLRNHRNQLRLSAAAQIYKDEAYGDSILTYAIASQYEQRAAKLVADREFEVYKSLPISDDRLKSNIMIPSGDPSFEAFKNKMDNECETAVQNLYGKFSVLTSPILSQQLLSKLAKQFKVTLPRQHLSIMVMLNKHLVVTHQKLKKNEEQIDRYAMYIFVLLMHDISIQT